MAGVRASLLWAELFGYEATVGPMVHSLRLSVRRVRHCSQADRLECEPGTRSIGTINIERRLSGTAGCPPSGGIRWNDGPSSQPAGAVFLQNVMRDDCHEQRRDRLGVCGHNQCHDCFKRARGYGGSLGCQVRAGRLHLERSDD